MTAEGAVTADGLVVSSLPAVFLPAPLPRDGRIAFYDPEGADVPPESGDARRTDLTVVRPHGASVRRRTVPALTLPVDEALPLLEKLLTARSVSSNTAAYKFDALTVTPGPYQKPMPPIWIAAVQPEAIYHSARKGYSITTTALRSPFEDAKRQAAAKKAAATRKRKATQRSAAAKKAARTRAKAKT